MDWSANSSKGSPNAKAVLRQTALAARAAVTGRPERAAAIWAALRGLELYRAARTICWYVGVRDEVPTAEMIAAAAAESRRAVVPWRAGERLELFEIRGGGELAPASFGLLEPTAAVRESPARRVDAGAVDLFVVPGVAFDRQGRRLGYGRGYYDRLLSLARPEAAIVGLAFDAQLVPQVPAGDHDVAMDHVITESDVYPPAARASSGSTSS